jgi:undecaprenyl-diphosphatase
MFQVSIQFGAIHSYCSVGRNSLILKTFLFKNGFCCATSFSFRLSFDDKIEAGNQIAISSVLVLGGVVLLFVDNWFKNLQSLMRKIFL